MDNETLRKVQLVQLEILREIVRVCELNDIKYFLIGGTMLGAVRHQGFIPWDDDLDIGIMRTDYEKFLSVAPLSLNKRYKLVDWKTDKTYPHPMAKVIKKGTVYRERKRKDAGEQGIWVDVFPYDSIESVVLLKKRVLKLKALRSLIRAKCKYQTWQGENGILIGKFIKNLPFTIMSIFVDKANLIRKYEALSIEADSEASKCVFENGTEDYSKWCFPKAYFQEFVNISFEDEDYIVPKKYHEYLSIAYGDYMKLPPESERENRHLIEEIYFGEDV